MNVTDQRPIAALRMLRAPMMRRYWAPADVISAID